MDAASVFAVAFRLDPDAAAVDPDRCNAASVDETLHKHLGSSIHVRD